MIIPHSKINRSFITFKISGSQVSKVIDRTWVFVVMEVTWVMEVMEVTPRTLVMCTPRLLWIPPHSMQSVTPKLMLAHWGPSAPQSAHTCPGGQVSR